MRIFFIALLITLVFSLKLSPDLFSHEDPLQVFADIHGHYSSYDGAFITPHAFEDPEDVPEYPKGSVFIQTIDQTQETVEPSASQVYRDPPGGGRVAMPTFVMQLVSFNYSSHIAATYGFKLVDFFNNYTLWEHAPLVQNGHFVESVINEITEKLVQDAGVYYVHFQYSTPTHIARRISHTTRSTTDPGLRHQWFLDRIKADVAWNTHHLSGSGVQVAIIDNGVDNTHPDISSKFQEDDSFDFTLQRRHMSISGDSHGSACAGLVAAARNNHCGLGVAYNAKISSLKVISGRSTNIAPFNRAQSFAFSLGRNMIYSASIGSVGCDDNRLTSIYPEVLSSLILGASLGRDFKGAIYVIAAGNERSCKAWTSLDELLSTRFPIVVGASTTDNEIASYSNGGATVFVVAPSSGDGKKIYTTGTGTSCNDEFGGTSAATPIVSGVVALMLEADPNLTWRDVKDIIARTSQKIDSGSGGWKNNGAGLHVHHDYGFGMIRADLAIAEVKRRKTANSYLNQEEEIHIDTTEINRNIPDASGWVWVDSTAVLLKANIRTAMIVEHVIVYLRVNHEDRGDLRIELKSPNGGNGHKCVLMKEHRGDDNTHGLIGPRNRGFFFGCTQFWGERSEGQWQVRVYDQYWQDDGRILNWKLQIYGHKANAADQRRLPLRAYFDFTLKSGDGFVMPYNHAVRNPQVYCVFQTMDSPQLMSNTYDTSDRFNTQIRLPATSRYNFEMDILNVICKSQDVGTFSQHPTIIGAGVIELDLKTQQSGTDVVIRLDTSLGTARGTYPSITIDWRLVRETT